MANFKEQYLNDEIDIDQLDDFIASWHKDKPKLSLQEFLGLNDDEFTAFAHGETQLKQKLDALKKEKAVSVLKALSKIVK